MRLSTYPLVLGGWCWCWGGFLLLLFGGVGVGVFGLFVVGPYRRKILIAGVCIASQQTKKNATKREISIKSRRREPGKTCKWKRTHCWRANIPGEFSGLYAARHGKARRGRGRAIDRMFIIVVKNAARLSPYREKAGTKLRTRRKGKSPSCN